MNEIIECELAKVADDINISPLLTINNLMTLNKEIDSAFVDYKSELISNLINMIDEYKRKFTLTVVDKILTIYDADQSDKREN